VRSVAALYGRGIEQDGFGALVAPAKSRGDDQSNQDEE
jgi:hypothetical protein